jgi:predicted ATPase
MIEGDRVLLAKRYDMRILALTAKNLFETLDLELEFFNDLNLLVGINGSGKTTALSVIDWLLTPNLMKLATQTYDHLSLTLVHENQEFTITADKSDTELSVGIKTTGDTFAPISVKIDPENPRDQTEERYRGLTPEDHEEKAWSFLQRLKKPTVVSLERTITAEVDDEIYHEAARQRTSRRNRTTITPLGHVQEIFGQQYADFRTIALENDARLKSRIILTALHSPDSDEPDLSNFQMPLESTEQLETKVKGYLASSIPSEDVERNVGRFFNYFRSLGDEIEKSAEKSGKVVNLIQAQFSRVDQLARAFKEFEENNATAFSRLNEYLTSVNLFLKDSGKLIIADDSRGRLVFRELRDGIPFGPNRPINKLSSGETQIIILFALMAFEADKNSIFIVDEPELSLHPKWQSEFMSSFLKLCPSSSQVLVATHSPEIVAGRKSACVFL